ncbi:MAG: alpha/beta hydrolase, partial [Rhodococcus sp. (in: high G+C Gram-positive bacteria)]|uniref:alpha/beta fold hydrolase n=1 Tax=Rhodococcus sp. TaxID=1831 RepID=UPI003BAEC4D1
DPRGFLRDQYYSFSGGPYPADYKAPNPLDASPADVEAQIRSSGVCLEPGAKMRDGLLTPDPIPEWLAADLDDYVAEFERTGLQAPLNWYRAMDLSWEELEPFAGRPIEAPALFIGAEFDVATLWSSEAVAAFDKTVPNHRASVVIKGCGHWFTRERPIETTAAIVDFLENLEVQRAKQS